MPMRIQNPLGKMMDGTTRAAGKRQNEGPEEAIVDAAKGGKEEGRESERGNDCIQPKEILLKME